jgi:hypothetical protein
LFALLTALFNGLASVLQRMAAMTAPASKALRQSLLGAAAQNLWTAAVLLAAVVQTRNGVDPAGPHVTRSLIPNGPVHARVTVGRYLPCAFSFYRRSR